MLNDRWEKILVAYRRIIGSRSVFFLFRCDVFWQISPNDHFVIPVDYEQKRPLISDQETTLSCLTIRPHVIQSIWKEIKKFSRTE